jgi:adenosine deaminase
VELHVHLEGAIPYAALLELLRKYGSPIRDEKALIERLKYRSFTQFLNTWTWKNRYLRDYEDFELIAEQVAHDWATQNIRYVETNFSPPVFRGFGLEADGLAEAIRRGLSKVEGICVQLIADFCRNTSVPLGMEMLDSLYRVRTSGVVGVDLGRSQFLF